MATSNLEAPAATTRQVISLPIDDGLTCLRGLSPQRLRFELEYALERGSTANSFLFNAGTDGEGQRQSRTSGASSRQGLRHGLPPGSCRPASRRNHRTQGGGRPRQSQQGGTAP